MQATAKETVEAFWETMTTNDCGAVGALLADDYVLEWPQSGEVIRGRDNFAAVNRHDPVNSPRRFTVHQVPAKGS